MKFLMLISIIFIQQNLFAFEIHAHRGGSSNYSKNSMNAILEGLEKGAYASELDIHLTKDDHFVVIHDPVIDLKKCKSPIQKQLDTLVVRNLSLAEVTSFKCKNGDYLPENIPSLEDVLIETKKYNTQKLNIEMKYSNKATKYVYKNNYTELYPSLNILAAQLHEILTKHNSYDRVIIQSFSVDFLVLIKTISDSVITSYLYKGSYLKLLPEKVIAKHKIRKYLWIPNYRKAFKIMKHQNFDYFSPTVGQISHKLYKKQFKKHIINSRNKQNVDFKILPWTVNDKDKINDYLGELDGVITDRPELFM